MHPTNHTIFTYNIHGNANTNIHMNTNSRRVREVVVVVVVVVFVVVFAYCGLRRSRHSRLDEKHKTPSRALRMVVGSVGGELVQPPRSLIHCS